MLTDAVMTVHYRQSRFAGNKFDLPTTNVQVCCLGNGSHDPLLVQVEFITVEGRYPLLHQ